MSLRSLSVFSFIHFIVWMQKIINDPDQPIEFLLGGAKNFQIGGGIHSLSACYKWRGPSALGVFQSFWCVYENDNTGPYDYHLYRKYRASLLSFTVVRNIYIEFPLTASYRTLILSPMIIFYSKNLRVLYYYHSKLKNLEIHKWSVLNGIK